MTVGWFAFVTDVDLRFTLFVGKIAEIYLSIDLSIAKKAACEVID